MSPVERAKQAFAEKYNEEPALIVRAPGRVNLIGDHTDYNEGYVLPMTIDRWTVIALRAREDGCVHIASLNLDAEAEFDLSKLKKGDAGWVEYVKGVAWALSDAGYALRGWEGVMIGDVPIGAGLSSSASLELVTARAFASVSGLPWDAVEMAKLAQRAENEWVGMNSGIMDQLIVAAGKAGHALKIDCRSLEIEHIPLPPDSSIVIMDTGTRRELVASAYNQRRAECEAAGRHFKVSSLRDLSISRFEKDAEEMEEALQKRTRHVLTENQRTILAAEMLRSGGVTTVGKIMLDSHKSLRDDYEVSSNALDVMVECAMDQPSVYGARMTGAGFGGAAVALVDDFAANSVASQAKACYEEKTANTAEMFIVRPVDGAEVVST